MNLDYLALIVISILAIASVLWFFRKRRELIMFLKEVTVTLEEYFKPVDKTYTWLGYLVGYEARYELPRGDKVYILLTTTPRHVFFYLPVLILLKRRDRIRSSYRAT